MRGLSFAGSRSKLGSSMAVRKHRAWLLACARARAACVPRLGTLSPCTVAHNTHKRKVRDIHAVAAQALCLSGCVTRPRRFFGTSSTGCTVSIFFRFCFFYRSESRPERPVRVLSPPEPNFFSRRVGPRDG